jgi:hypothetical protein
MIIYTHRHLSEGYTIMTTAELQQLRAELARRNIRFTWTARHVVITDPTAGIVIAHDSPRLETIIQGLKNNQPLTAFLQPGYSGS